MKRTVIKIDANICNGCGNCISGCPEGALQLVDGKARLVSDLLCDGLGACIGTCPLGAITFEEREAEPYDEAKVMVNMLAGGPGLVKAHLLHLKDHGQKEYLAQAIDYLKKNGHPVPELNDCASMPQGCPGSRMIHQPKKAESLKDVRVAGDEDRSRQSELSQWPIQLRLLNPMAPFFDDADLLVAADCVPFAFPSFHEQMLAGKSLIIFCPKLDSTIDEYLDKMTEIFRRHTVKSVTVARMEVPCCGGVKKIVQMAMAQSGKDIPLKEITISLSGEIKS